MLNIDNNTSPEYLEGYLDGISDALGKLSELSETPELYKVKELFRETINNADGQLEG